tara:strand:+ start:1140 stop:1418 length:279 start_codon:yes stop_codon:yes gene_type:complete
MYSGLKLRSVKMKNGGAQLEVFNNKPRDAEIQRMMNYVAEKEASGELCGLAFVTVNKDGTIGSAFSEGCTENIFDSIGGLEYLKQRLLDCIE